MFNVLHLIFPCRPPTYLVYRAGDDTVEAGRGERNQPQYPGRVGLQSLDQLAGLCGPDVQISPQSGDSQALVTGQQAGARPLGRQEDVLGSPR